MTQIHETARTPVRIYRTEELVMIAAPMPGLGHEDVTITVGSDRRVVLEGKLCSDGHLNCGSLKGAKEVILDEWHPGHYRREVELPTPVDAAHGRVTYGNGIVVVVLPVSAHMTVGQLTCDNPPDIIEEASDESFPASDPPAWTGTRAR